MCTLAPVIAVLIEVYCLHNKLFVLSREVNLRIRWLWTFMSQKATEWIIWGRQRETTPFMFIPCATMRRVHVSSICLSKFLLVEERVVQGLTNLYHYNPLYVKVFRRVWLMVISLITIDEEIRRVDGSVHHHHIANIIAYPLNKVASV